MVREAEQRVLREVPRGKLEVYTRACRRLAPSTSSRPNHTLDPCPRVGSIPNYHADPRDRDEYPRRRS